MQFLQRRLQIKFNWPTFQEISPDSAGSPRGTLFKQDLLLGRDYLQAKQTTHNTRHFGHTTDRVTVAYRDFPFEL